MRRCLRVRAVPAVGDGIRKLTHVQPSRSVGQMVRAVLALAVPAGRRRPLCRLRWQRLPTRAERLVRPALLRVRCARRAPQHHLILQADLPLPAIRCHPRRGYV